MGPLLLGRIVATPEALEVLAEAGEDLHLLLARHASGDWGTWTRTTAERTNGP